MVIVMRRLLSATAAAVVLTALQTSGQPQSPSTTEVAEEAVTDAEFHLPVSDKLAVEIDAEIALLGSPQYDRR